MKKVSIVIIYLDKDLNIQIYEAVTTDTNDLRYPWEGDLSCGTFVGSVIMRLEDIMEIRGCHVIDSAASY